MKQKHRKLFSKNFDIKKANGMFMWFEALTNIKSFFSLLRYLINNFGHLLNIFDES